MFSLCALISRANSGFLAHKVTSLPVDAIVWARAVPHAPDPITLICVMFLPIFKLSPLHHGVGQRQGQEANAGVP